MVQTAEIFSNYHELKFNIKFVLRRLTAYKYKYNDLGIFINDSKHNFLQ